RASLGGPDERREQKFATLVGDHFGMSPTNILLTPFFHSAAWLSSGAKKNAEAIAAVKMIWLGFTVAPSPFIVLFLFHPSFSCFESSAWPAHGKKRQCS
ncbi:hypothetical protein, partial [Geobacillus jurassicus]